MVVVAGPPGSGKSSIFLVASFSIPYFNADDRAAELNGGSYGGILKTIRAIANRDFEAFVLGSIEKHKLCPGNDAPQPSSRQASPRELALRRRCAILLFELSSST